ncbi:NAD+ diphosphatase [Sphingomonas sp. BE138]|uniref:NAD(+) diphosphatase n=1 Tax=Sphingomonas sp. BE138 TaxID=2817845 RepID=UPI002856B565|nr:NAD(+) diphosphatase [Sphingomonas sp. BE138]MDR6787129.1 NAD+ diphosphatase [Sphingomonas sp. BE138]
MTIATGFTGGTLDRADALRHDPAAVAALLADPSSRLLLLSGFEPVVGDDGLLGWGTIADAPCAAEFVLLGLGEGRAHFAAVVPGDAPPPPYRSPTLFALLDRLRDGEAATFAAARALIDWHARHPFCARCGHATAMFRAGWGRACPNCAAEHFPRVDPVVIMIAEHDGRALVGRQAAWPAGRYSALAGFLEPGESIEEAVAREIGEEAGVRVRDVRYVASQPWPFPSQLMIACVARADDDAITLDANELEHAMWVTRDEVRAALAGEAGAFGAPPPYAIAHSLLRAWADGEG